MNETELKKLVDSMITDRTKYFWKASEVDAYLKSKNFDYSRKNLTTLILHFSENSIFRWLDFISSKLPEIASDSEEFVELILRIGQKVKGDMAQGPFVRSLIAIGSSDSNLGLALFKRMIALQDLKEYAGLVLGGAGQKDFAKIFGEIQNNIRSSDSATKASYIKALRVIFEKGAEIREEDNIFEILKSAARIEEDKIVRSEAANAFIDFCSLNRKACFEQLMSLARQEDSDIRSLISQRLWITDLDDGKNEMEVLRECSRDENPNTMSMVAMALSKKGKRFPKESLDIIRDWMIQRKFSEIRDIDYCLQEIGKANTGICIDVVSSWIDEENPIFGVYAPRILTNIAIGDGKELLDHLEEMTAKGSKRAKIAIRTIGDMLLRNKPSEDVIGRCFAVLKQVATNEELQDDLFAELMEIFGQKPRLAADKQVLDIVRDWATDADPRVRRSMLVGLGEVAEDKIDIKETLSLETNKVTGVTRIVGTNIEKVETNEGCQAYNLLKELSQDPDPKVKEEAGIILERVNNRLLEKESRIEAHAFQSRIFETLKTLRALVDMMERPRVRMGADYPEIDLVIQMKDGKKFLIELKYFRGAPQTEKMEELIALGRSAKERHGKPQLILVVNDKKPVDAWVSQLSKAWDYVFDESELKDFTNKLLEERENIP